MNRIKYYTHYALWAKKLARQNQKDMIEDRKNGESTMFEYEAFFYRMDWLWYRQAMSKISKHTSSSIIWIKQIKLYSIKYNLYIDFLA